MKKRLFPLFAVAIPLFTLAQTGITVSPPRTYFESRTGEAQEKKILVTNPSKTSALNLTVSFSDWQYNQLGDNLITEPNTLDNSMVSWISIMPQSYFTLAPGETRELSVHVTPPPLTDRSEPVHTAMMYITQTNPTDGVNEQGALIKVAVRTGVKIYHRDSSMPASPDIEFTDFKFQKENSRLLLALKNTGNIWTDGTIVTELTNQSDGSKIKLEDQVIYTMPEDDRSVLIPLPKDFKKGKYIATSTFSYGDNDIIKMAELTFNYE